MDAHVSPEILANIHQIRGGPMTCMPFSLTSKYYGYFIIFVRGRGALAKAKEGQRESLK